MAESERYPTEFAWGKGHNQVHESVSQQMIFLQNSLKVIFEKLHAKDRRMVSH